AGGRGGGGAGRGGGFGLGVGGPERVRGPAGGGRPGGARGGGAAGRGGVRGGRAAACCVRGVRRFRGRPFPPALPPENCGCGRGRPFYPALPPGRPPHVPPPPG